jgi:hypothetical protein
MDAVYFQFDYNDRHQKIKFYRKEQDLFRNQPPEHVKNARALIVELTGLKATVCVIPKRKFYYLCEKHNVNPKKIKIMLNDDLKLT